MRETYKEIFNEIKPDNEILEYAVISAEMNEKSVIKTIAGVLSFVFILAGIGTGVWMFGNSNKKETVDLPVAYETKGVLESMKHINSEIKSNKKTIKINADVIIEGNVNDLCIYRAEYAEQSIERIETLLYGKNGYFQAKNERKGAVMPILSPRGTGINFETESKAIAYDKYLESKIQQALKEKQNACCEISYSDARKIADSFLVEGGFDNYCFNKGDIIPVSSQGGRKISGYYDFQYYQYVDGFSLETVSPDVYNGVASDLNIRVDDDGIVGLRVCGLNLYDKQELNGIMTVEEAIDLIENQLSELWLSEYAPIVEIRLEYLLDELDNGSMVLVPCWHFCIDETELKIQPIDIQRENDTNDLCVNAVTGEFYRVGNRYPVFQYSDGSIEGTFKK